MADLMDRHTRRQGKDTSLALALKMVAIICWAVAYPQLRIRTVWDRVHGRLTATQTTIRDGCSRR